MTRIIVELHDMEEATEHSPPGKMLRRKMVVRGCPSGTKVLTATRFVPEIWMREGAINILQLEHERVGRDLTIELGRQLGIWPQSD